MSRRAKIAATLGPATDRPATLRAMIDAGLDVARINFSHGTHDEHRGRRRLLERATRGSRSVALLADLQGPRFRVGILPGGALELRRGKSVELVGGAERSEEGTIPVPWSGLVHDVRAGSPIRIDDGRIELVVRRRSRKRNRLRCEVVRGGVVGDRKGINLPGTAIASPALTAKDRRDLDLAIELRADWLAISFVRSAADVRTARRLLRRRDSAMPVLAKIERPEAIDDLPAILDEADGLLVARGDLGVELEPEQVPMLQKQIIEAANACGRPVMTATQMLDSMRHAPRPTRAEASDVANAVLDGSGCLLLTGETAAGEYPVDAVRMMGRIIDSAEASGRPRRLLDHLGSQSIPGATCRAACRAAADIGARYLIVFTQSGFSALQTARYRPPTPILAFSPEPSVVQRLNLLWGVEPHVLPARRSVESLMRQVDRWLRSHRRARKGDVVVALCGAPIGVPGTTNLVQVHRVGALD